MYNTKIIVSGDHIEIYKMYNYHVREGKRSEAEIKLYKHEKEIDAEYWGTSENKKNNISQYEKESNRLKSRNRARNKILRLVRANDDMCTFITLTFKEVPEITKAKTYLNKFFTNIRKNVKHFKYLWVLELGDKNKRLHFHVVCNYPIKFKLNSSREKKSDEHKRFEREFAAKYWPYGIVDIRNFTKTDNNNIALYVSAYLVKSLQNIELNGMRIYGYSYKTLDKPIETTYLSLTEKLEDIVDNLSDYRVKFSNNYDIGYEGCHGHVLYLDMIKK